MKSKAWTAAAGQGPTPRKAGGKPPWDSRDPNSVTPRLDAWHQRGIPGEKLPDTLWRAACWEASAVELAEAGQVEAAEDAFKRADAIMAGKR